jgi:predicted DsbA family dithiol-disulfide isomerase
VRQALERGRAIGVSGVPTFVAAGRYALSGAQPVEVLVEFFRRCASGQEPA